MRIGIFDPYLDDLGGGEKYMMTIAQILSADNRVDVFWSEKQDLDSLTKRFSLDLSKVNLVDNIFDQKFSLIQKLKISLKYDVIIILSDGSLPILLSKKTIIHFQQPFPHIKPNFKNKLKAKRISKIFCNSEYTKSFIDKEFGLNSQVLYPPVTITDKNLPKENIILNVGRFRVKDITTNASGNKLPIGDFKKQSVMVSVFKELIDEGLLNWKFVIAVSVNKNEEKAFDEFKKTAKGYPIEFLVNKTNNELWEIYSKSKIYWHASGYGENLSLYPEYAEHFGISTVEAMGVGAVPVVINAGGQKEIVKDNQNGFLWDSTQELKDKTNKLISSETLLSKFSQNAKQSAINFSLENFKKELFDLIK